VSGAIQILKEGASRSSALRRGLLLAFLTVGGNLLEGFGGVFAGLLAGSVALVGFGIDSFIETASAVVVGWRLLSEERGYSAEAVEQIERTAGKVTGALLLLLALYILIDAGARLFGFGAEAKESKLGLALTALSLIVMPILGRAKLRTSTALGSRALRSDAYETIFCAWLSLATLVGLALNVLFRWWWGDPVAALVLVPLIAREGLEGWRGGSCGCSGGEENGCEGASM